MKIYLITIIIFAAIALFFFTREVDWPKEKKAAQTPQSSAVPTSVLETQTNSEGPVTIKITPKLSSGLAFEMVLDTHSEELDADLIQVTTLKDENDKEYKPIRWEGSPPGGHHREGVLTFGTIARPPRTLQLVIRGIGGVLERKFLWTTRP